MKKFLLFLFTLFAVGGVDVCATKVYADLSALKGGGGAATWESSTQTMTWTATSNNMLNGFNFPTGDLSAYETITINVSDVENAAGIRIQMKANGTEGDVKALNGEGTFTIALSDLAQKSGMDLTKVEWIRVLGSAWQNSESHTIKTESPASAKINYVYLEKPTTLDFDGLGTASIDLTDITASGGLSYDAMTGVVTTDGTEGDLDITFAAPIDLSSMTKFTVSCSESGNGKDIISWTNFYKQDAQDGSKAVHSTSAWYSSKYGLSFTAEQAERAHDVVSIKLHAGAVAKKDGETDEERTERIAAMALTIQSVTITADVMTSSLGGERNIETLTRKYYDSGEWKTGSISVRYGQGIETPVGDGSLTQDEYIDLADYEELRMYVSSGEIRAFFVKESGFDPTKDGYIITKDGVKQNGQWNGTQDTDHKLQKGDEFYYISVEDIKAACGGEAKLIGIKAEYGQTVYISKVSVIGEGDADYNLAGKGLMLDAVATVLADRNATLYDATGLTNTAAITLTPANENALLLVSDAARLTNTKNVVVTDGTAYTAANIELTDGYLFRSPYDINATAASYTRSGLEASTWGTAVLPFDLDVETCTAASIYEFTSADEDNVTFTLKADGTVAANTPFVYYTEQAGDVTFTGTSIAKTLSGYQVQDIGQTGWSIAQSMEETVIDDVAADATLSAYDVYGISGTDFVHATKKLTLKPFRAFFLKAKSSGEGGAKARYAIRMEDGGAATAVSGRPSASTAVEVARYNTAGQRLSAPQPGLNIVRMSDHSVKKVMVQ